MYYRALRVQIPQLGESAYPHLVDLFYSLTDGGVNQISLLIEASATSGQLDKHLIDLTLPELLAQHGIRAELEWEE
jgi:hypothetical protein